MSALPFSVEKQSMLEALRLELGHKANVSPYLTKTEDFEEFTRPLKLSLNAIGQTPNAF